MKKILFLLIIFVLIVSCGKKTDNQTESLSDNTNESQKTEDNSLQRVKNSGKLVLGLDDTFMPMGFKNENGEIVGFDIDLAREVAFRMGVKLETKSIDWGNSTYILNNGEIDVLWNGVNINEDRKQYMIFSKPYLNNMLIIVKYNNNETINSIDDLVGKVVGVQYGGNYNQIANNPVMSKIKEVRQYNDNVSAFLDLQSERVEAVVVDDTFAEYYIKEKKLPFTIVNKTPFTDGLYVVAARKSDVQLLNEIDRILDEMKADGTTVEISTKWFGKDIILK